jgi:hypothetical protein
MKSRRDFERYVGYGNDKKHYIPYYIRELGYDSQQLDRYIEETLQPHMALWQEAVLAAAIWFLKEEIGISKIYYHTFEFGCKLKRISGNRPPQSLYTRLPSRFCFEKTDCAPEFLLKKIIER